MLKFIYNWFDSESNDNHSDFWTALLCNVLGVSKVLSNTNENLVT